MSGDAVLPRDHVEHEVVRILRDDVLGGSDRSTPLDAPLGQIGVALDSLAIVQLVTAIEAAFGVELPDDVLANRGSLSLGELVDLVAGSSPEREPAATPPALDLTLPPPHHRMERLRHRLEARGLPGQLLWTAARLAWPPARFMFARSRHFILERPVRASEQAMVEPPPGVTLQEGIPAGADLSGLWPDFVEKRSRRLVERWLREGAWSLAALEGERVVALDLLSAAGYDEIELRAERLACWGLYLVEAPAVRGRGIGLALLAYSLQSASDRGFCAQLTSVRDDNRPMIAACMQILGFRRLGTATRTRMLGATRWSWEVEGRTGRGRRLTL